MNAKFKLEFGFILCGDAALIIPSIKGRVNFENKQGVPEIIFKERQLTQTDI